MKTTCAMQLILGLILVLCLTLIGCSGSHEYKLTIGDGTHTVTTKDGTEITTVIAPDGSATVKITETGVAASECTAVPVGVPVPVPAPTPVRPAGKAVVTK